MLACKLNEEHNNTIDNLRDQVKNYKKLYKELNVRDCDKAATILTLKESYKKLEYMWNESRDKIRHRDQIIKWREKEIDKQDAAIAALREALETIPKRLVSVFNAEDKRLQDAYDNGYAEGRRERNDKKVV